MKSRRFVRVPFMPLVYLAHGGTVDRVACSFCFSESQVIGEV